MILKNWGVITVLALVGIALFWYWLAQRPDPGVVAQGAAETTATAIAALAGAITTLATAVSGAFMKVIEYRKAGLEVKAAELALEKQRRELQDKP